MKDVDIEVAATETGKEVAEEESMNDSEQQRIDRMEAVLHGLRRWLIYKTDDDGTEYTVWPEWIEQIDEALQPTRSNQ